MATVARWLTEREVFSMAELYIAISAMTNSSSIRGRAEQAFRLARHSTDPVLIGSLTESGQELLA
jgi:hypothetical protein